MPEARALNLARDLTRRAVSVWRLTVRRTGPSMLDMPQATLEASGLDYTCGLRCGD